MWSKHTYRKLPSFPNELYVCPSTIEAIFVGLNTIQVVFHPGTGGPAVALRRVSLSIQKAYSDVIERQVNYKIIQAQPTHTKGVWWVSLLKHRVSVPKDGGSQVLASVWHENAPP